MAEKAFVPVEFAPVNVGRLMSYGGVALAKQVHVELAGLIPDIDEMTSYGIYYPKTDHYYAAVAADVAPAGLRPGRIEGGRYLSASLPGIEHVTEINPLFAEMQAHLGEANDASRPLVEVYNGIEEITLLAPIGHHAQEFPSARDSFHGRALQSGAFQRAPGPGGRGIS